MCVCLGGRSYFRQEHEGGDRTLILWDVICGCDQVTSRSASIAVVLSRVLSTVYGGGELWHYVWYSKDSVHSTYINVWSIENANESVHTTCYLCLYFGLLQKYMVWWMDSCTMQVLMLSALLCEHRHLAACMHGWWLPKMGSIWTWHCIHQLQTQYMHYRSFDTCIQGVLVPSLYSVWMSDQMTSCIYMAVSSSLGGLIWPQTRSHHSALLDYINRIPQCTQYLLHTLTSAILSVFDSIITTDFCHWKYSKGSSFVLSNWKLVSDTDCCRSRYTLRWT